MCITRRKSALVGCNFPKGAGSDRRSPCQTSANRGGAPIYRSIHSTLGVLAAASVIALGCQGNAWETALATDSLAGYHQFVRKHPGSDHLPDAHERIAFHRVNRRPTVAGYQEFRAEYPESELLAVLRARVEGLAFDAVRGAGTADAYAAFAREFPAGAYSTRAKGNASYLASGGFRGQPAKLRAFATEHPASDFAAEAMRSVKALATHRRTQFRRVGLVIEISPATPEADRLRQAFTKRAIEMYKEVGLKLVRIPEVVADASGDLPPVRLRIRHQEELEATIVSGNDLTRGAFVARTQVTLQREPGS